MKKFILLLVIPFTSLAQDTTKIAEPPAKKINHEIAINTTLLLKQIFNLSNNTFPTLPYDVTYKLIIKKSAIRVGAGINMTNSSLTTSTTSTNQNSAPSGPDAVVPTINKSSNLFYRVGWEKRYTVGTRVAASWGVDFAGQYGKSNSQSSSGFNSLPNNYNFTKTTDNLKMMAYGGGPVVGIQVFITKRISVSTEVPLYFQVIQQTEVTENFQNNYSSFNGWTSSTNTQTQTTKGTKFSLTLPVTLYLAIKF
jgi:hypothetical protein